MSETKASEDFEVECPPEYDGLITPTWKFCPFKSSDYALCAAHMADPLRGAISQLKDLRWNLAWLLNAIVHPYLEDAEQHTCRDVFHCILARDALFDRVEKSVQRLDLVLGCMFYGAIFE